MEDGYGGKFRVAVIRPRARLKRSGGGGSPLKEHEKRRA
jgi:hypothetical protein